MDRFDYKTEQIQKEVKVLREMDDFKVTGKNGEEIGIKMDFLIEYLDNLDKGISRRTGIIEEAIGNLSDLIVGRNKNRTLKYSVGRVSKKLRDKILLRDNFTCKNCGVHRDIAVLNVDHIFPRSMGGKAEENNLQVLCKSCNLLKLNRIFNEKKTQTLKSKSVQNASEDKE